MAFRIARPILALPVRLISGFGVYARPGGTGASEVCVNVRDVYDKPGTGHVYRLRRSELVLSSNAVKPDSCLADSDFTMDGLAVGRALDTPRFETKRFNQEVMSRLNVVIYQQRDNACECRHKNSPYELSNRKLVITHIL
jgi:hypothetical protein